ncbi:hypothetical protein L901_21005 [Agrobacterium sp. D14]|nr:hypothetical protein L901_21005 [Agrobacterium sp. D14]
MAHVFCMNAISDRGANQQMDNLVCEVIVAHQPKRIVRCRCKVKKLPIAAKY